MHGRNNIVLEQRVQTDSTLTHHRRCAMLPLLTYGWHWASYLWCSPMGRYFCWCAPEHHRNCCSLDRIIPSVRQRSLPALVVTILLLCFSNCFVCDSISVPVESWCRAACLLILRARNITFKLFFHHFESAIGDSVADKPFYLFPFRRWHLCASHRLCCGECVYLLLFSIWFVAFCWYHFRLLWKYFKIGNFSIEYVQRRIKMWNVVEKKTKAKWRRSVTECVANRFFFKLSYVRFCHCVGNAWSWLHAVVDSRRWCQRQYQPSFEQREFRFLYGNQNG